MPLNRMWLLSIGLLQMHLIFMKFLGRGTKKQTNKQQRKTTSVYLQMNVDTKNSKMEKISQVAKVTHNQVHIEIKVSVVT